MEKEFKKYPIITEVEIKHYREPARGIRMTLEEYGEFIRDQAVELGFIEKEPKKEPAKKIDGFQGVLTGVKIPKEFMVFEKMAKEFEKAMDEELKRKGK